MSKWSIAAKPKDEQNKVNVDLAFSAGRADRVAADGLAEPR